MRIKIFVVTIVALMLLLAAAAPRLAVADSSNNGTLKIHEGNTESEPLRANDPHVCTFHLHGFNFDAGASGAWRIDVWHPTSEPDLVREGSFSADATGAWRTAVMSLPDGHYKTFAKQNNEPTVGGDKQKVFWVDCTPVTTVATPTPVIRAATPTPIVSVATATPIATPATPISNPTSNASTTSAPNATASPSVTAGAAVNATSPAPSPTDQPGIANSGISGLGNVTTPTSPSQNDVAGFGAVAYPAVRNLPSTSTDAGDATLPSLGAILILVGLAILVRPSTKIGARDRSS